MGFNPDPSKQVQEIVFSRKTKKLGHPTLHFNNSIVSRFQYQNHLGVFLGTRLTFEKHLKVITTKVNKTIGLLLTLQKTLPRPVLLAMYKAFVRPHLDYGDLVYDKT